MGLSGMRMGSENVSKMRNRSPNIVREIKSRRFRWAGHVARMEEARSALKILTGKLQELRRIFGPNRNTNEE